MFLPEHREQLLATRRNRREYRMPELDEDWLADMSRMLSDSLEYGQPITIVYGTQYETQRFKGIVRQIDPYAGWVKLARASVEETNDAGVVEETEEEHMRQVAFQRIVEIREG